jgi:C4-dicarboxylate-binding protein
MKEATDAINQRLEGQVKFVLFPNGQLPVYKDGLQQVVRGADFIDVDDLSYIGDYVPEFTALAGPMLYQNYDEYVKLMHSDLVADLKKKAEEKGIKIISLDFIFGFRSIISDKEIKEPADLKGMKIRVPASKLFIDTLNAMGASAVPMSFSETISALQQNVIDGLEGSYATNYLTKTYELRKNMSLTKHFLGTAGVYISTKVWDKLTDEQKAIIQEEFDKAAENNNKNLVELDKELVKNLEDAGVKINEVNLPEFAKLVEPIYKNIGITEEFYKQLMDEMEKIRTEQK